jgi:hypothetical protein
VAAINQDDTFYAGNKRILEFTIINKDVVPEAPLNLTGITLKWGMSRLNSDGTYSKTPVVQKSTSSGITVTNAAQGKCSVQLDASDTVNCGGKYHQELEAIDGSGAPVVVAVGTLELLRNVTNS